MRGARMPTVHTSLLKATKGGIITKLNIELDGDTLHKSVTKEFDVLTGSAAVLTLKTGTQVLAQSNDDKDSYIDSTIGKTISITATADSVLGDVSDIDWDSSNPDVASFVSVPKNGKVDLKVGGAGTTKITATLGGKTATFEVRVLETSPALRFMIQTARQWTIRGADGRRRRADSKGSCLSDEI